MRRATIAGRVMEAAGTGVAGAVISIDETGDMTTTASDGSYSLELLGDSTATLRVLATGFAPTRVQPIEVPSDTRSDGFDLVVLPQAEIARYNTAAGVGADTHAVVLATVVSLSATCALTAPVIAIHPDAAGRVLPFDSLDGGVPPDAGAGAGSGNLGGGGFAAVVAAVQPPSIYFTLSASQPGCTQARFPVSFEGRRHLGGFAVAAGALTHTTLFME